MIEGTDIVRGLGRLRSEVSRAVVYAFLMRSFQVVGGLASLVFIAKYFTPKIQGFYYTFTSLASLQAYIELGFGIVIVQFASHEWARLSLDVEGKVGGHPDALSRLTSLGRIAFPLYAVQGAILTLVLSLLGLVLFSASPDPEVQWLWPWLTVSVFTGMNLWLLPALALLEGCNQVSQVYFYRFTDTVLTNVCLCVFVALGAGLWAPAISAIVKLVYGCAYLVFRHRRFLLTFLARPVGPSMNWRSDILPMQWRMSLTWLSGALLFTLFTPVAFHYQGPVVAGQVGMTLNMTSALLAVSFVWVQTNMPNLGRLIAKRDFITLDRVFFPKAALSVLTGILGAAGIFFIVYFLHTNAGALSGRVLPLTPTFLFLLATLFMIASSPFGAYLRAHKREPLVGISVGASIVTGVSTWLFGSNFGPLGMAAGYMTVNMLTLAGVLLIWHRCRHEWHLERAPLTADRQTNVD